jgi:hypothetical protein
VDAVDVEVMELLSPLETATAIAATAMTPAPIAARVPTDMPATPEEAAPAAPAGGATGGALVCAMEAVVISKDKTVATPIMRLFFFMIFLDRNKLPRQCEPHPLQANTGHNAAMIKAQIFHVKTTALPQIARAC